jgi:ribosome-associated protein
VWLIFRRDCQLFQQARPLPESTVTHSEMNSKPSKSALKREYLALQTLGERLIALSAQQLADIVADERLRDAVVTAKSITSRGALRRQKQYIGRLMRDVDPEPIRAALEALGSGARQEKTVFRQAETWRDRISAGGDAELAAFFADLGHDDEALRRAVAALRAAVDDKTRKQAKRRVFREIHQLLKERMQSRGSSI